MQRVLFVVVVAAAMVAGVCYFANNNNGPSTTNSNLRQRQLLITRQRLYNCENAGCSLNSEEMGPPVCGVDDVTYYNDCLAFCQVSYLMQLLLSGSYATHDSML